MKSVGRLGCALAALLGACGGEPSASPTIADAGVDARPKPRPDAGPSDAAPDVTPPPARLTTVGGPVLGSLKLGIVYAGLDEIVGAPSADEYVTWLVGSGWWALMKQYGIGPGAVIGSVRVPVARIVPANSVDNRGVMGLADLRGSVDELASGGDGGAPLIPGANAYLVFLPWGINVDLGFGVTCTNASGFHDVTLGNVPYALIPGCAAGHSGFTISHELAEMVTDPFPYSGWEDHTTSKWGEIGDLCDTSTTWDGRVVTRLWSNDAGDCVP